MVFTLDESMDGVAKLKVVGIGGAGGNAVNRMVLSSLQGVEFVCVNTDAKALEHNKADIKIQIGTKQTSGLGAGANPQVGMMAAEEDRERLRQVLEGADMVFIAAGMGGGTGTGAAPVVAQVARELGILTVAVVTRPFLWEGPVRDKNSRAGIDALRKHVDTMIIIPNQKLLSIVEKNTTLKQAFNMADEVLTQATRGISEIILKHGDIQVDFADVRTIMTAGGDALMGTGTAAGENRATIAADRAIHSPLLDNVDIAGATGVLVNITGGENVTMHEVNDAMNYIYEAVGQDSYANIIFGTVTNPEMKDEISITVIATGYNGAGAQRFSENQRVFGDVEVKPIRQSNPEVRIFEAQKPVREEYYPSPEPQVTITSVEPAIETVAMPTPLQYGGYATENQNLNNQTDLKPKPQSPVQSAGAGGIRPRSTAFHAPLGGFPGMPFGGSDNNRMVEEVVLPSQPQRGMASVAKPVSPVMQQKPQAQMSVSQQGANTVNLKDQPTTRLNLVNPAVRQEDDLVIFSDARQDAKDSKKRVDVNVQGSVLPFTQKGRFKDYDGDTDYDTPTFLRNQAD